MHTGWAATAVHASRRIAQHAVRSTKCTVSSAQCSVKFLDTSSNLVPRTNVVSGTMGGSPPFKTLHGEKDPPPRTKNGDVTIMSGTSRNKATDKLQTKEDQHLAAFFEI